MGSLEYYVRLISLANLMIQHNQLISLCLLIDTKKKNRKEKRLRTRKKHRTVSYPHS